MNDENDCDPHKAATELPDDIRIPLHSLQADLFGRVAADGAVEYARLEMTLSASASELSQGFTALSDLIAVVQGGLGDKAADEQLISDGFKIAEGTLPQYALALMAANFLIDMIITYNLSGTPGSQTPIHDARRGSDENI